MERRSTIELHQDHFWFSVAHFTILSKTERERLHGHNYHVYTALDATYGKAGLSFDFRTYKDKITALCKELDHALLLPANSPHLQIENISPYYHIHFNNEALVLTERDCKILPLQNITVEELSRWFLERLLENDAELKEHNIQGITIKVFAEQAESGSAAWVRAS